MLLPVLHSLKAIERQYKTGEEPVLVICSDLNAYVCKYMRSSAASYKLASELIGGQMARIWRINAPEMAIVKIKAEHWNGLHSTHSVTAPTIGSRKKSGVIDIIPSTVGEIEEKLFLLVQLTYIALFDFWMANEDRNANNANLMYDIAHQVLVPIDYGCIFNTATFDYPLSQLTMTDSILSSDLYDILFSKYSNTMIKLIADLDRDYRLNVGRCQERAKSIVEQIPLEWNLPKEVIINKVNALFDSDWIDNVWQNFKGCLIEKC